MNYRIIYTDELYHHGVKGMKWGVRKDRRVADAESRYLGAKNDAKQARREAKSFSRRHAITSRISGSKNNQKAAELRSNVERKSKAVTDEKDKLDRTKNLVKTERYRDRLVAQAKNRAAWEVSEAKEANRNIVDLKKHGEKSDMYQRNMQRTMERKKREYESEHGEGSYHTIQAWADAVAYDQGSKQRISDMLTSQYSRRQSHIDEARRYVAKSKKLMNTPISELTTKRDIKNLYNNSGTLKPQHNQRNAVRPRPKHVEVDTNRLIPKPYVVEPHLTNYERTKVPAVRRPNNRKY